MGVERGDTLETRGRQWQDEAGWNTLCAICQGNVLVKMLSNLKYVSSPGTRVQA